MRNTTTRIARERKTRSRRGRKAVRSYPIAASRNDNRMLKLRMDLGIEGYAVYHMLMEKIAETDGCEYAIDSYSVLAFDFRVDEQLVKCVAEDYNLFCLHDGRLSPNGIVIPADNGEEDGDDDGTNSENPAKRLSIGTSATISAQKKEKENLPLHPLKEKDKEKERTEKKRISLAENITGGNNNKLKTTKNDAPDSSDKGKSDDCSTAEAEKQENGNNTEAKGANDDDSSIGGIVSHSKRSTPSAAEDKETRIESFLTYFSDYWNSVLASTNSRLRPIRVVNGERRKRLVRLRQNYTNEEISRFVFRAANSPYLNARDGRLRQPADLNWMLSTDDRIVKIIEGNM